jgi:hypothetical protein
VLRAAPLPNLGIKKIIWLDGEVAAAVVGSMKREGLLCPKYCRHRSKMLFIYVAATVSQMIHNPLQSLGCWVSCHYYGAV